jgi:hypothetical protein
MAIGNCAKKLPQDLGELCELKMGLEFLLTAKNKCSYDPEIPVKAQDVDDLLKNLNGCADLTGSDINSLLIILFTNKNN